jgi:hypothetical protein
MLARPHPSEPDLPRRLAIRPLAGPFLSHQPTVAPPSHYFLHGTSESPQFVHASTRHRVGRSDARRAHLHPDGQLQVDGCSGGRGLGSGCCEVTLLLRGLLPQNGVGSGGGGRRGRVRGGLARLGVDQHVKP